MSLSNIVANLFRYAIFLCKENVFFMAFLALPRNSVSSDSLWKKMEDLHCS